MPTSRTATFRDPALRYFSSPFGQHRHVHLQQLVEAAISAPMKSLSKDFCNDQDEWRKARKGRVYYLIEYINISQLLKKGGKGRKEKKKEKKKELRCCSLFRQ